MFKEEEHDSNPGIHWIREILLQFILQWVTAGADFGPLFHFVVRHLKK